jgi:hypothetical protein
MRFVPPFTSDDRENRLMNHMGNASEASLSNPIEGAEPKINAANISPDAKEATKFSIIDGGKKLIDTANDVIKTQYNALRGAIENLGDFAKKVTNDTPLEVAGEWLEDATDIRTNKPTSKPAAADTAVNTGRNAVRGDSPVARSSQENAPQENNAAPETKETERSPFEQEKFNQLQLREQEKFDAAGTEWSTLDVGISDPSGSSYIYKKVNVGGQDTLVAYTPDGGLQYMNAEKQWLPVDKNNQEMMSAVGTLDYNATIVQEMEAAEKAGKGKEYMETRFLKNGETDEDWLARNKDNKMWKGMNEPILEALLKDKEEAKPEEEEKPEETEKPEEKKPEETEESEEGQKETDEDKEKAEETPDARAKRILEETQKKLDELDAKYPNPEEEKKEQPETPEEEEEKVGEAKESDETEDERKNRLWAEVRGGEQVRKVDDVRTEKKDSIKKIETETATSVEEHEKVVSGQEQKVQVLKSQLDAAGDDKEAKKPMEAQLVKEEQALETEKDNLQTIKDNAEKAKKNLEEDLKMLDEMEKEVDKATTRSNEHIQQLAENIMTDGADIIGKLAKDISVKNDGSLGFSVDFPEGFLQREERIGDLQTVKIELMMNEKEKEEIHTNPSIILSKLDSFASATKEEYADARSRVGKMMGFDLDQVI